MQQYVRTVMSQGGIYYGWIWTNFYWNLGKIEGGEVESKCQTIKWEGGKKWNEKVIIIISNYIILLNQYEHGTIYAQNLFGMIRMCI